MPVIVGTAAAEATGSVRWWRAAVALLVSLSLQIGVNYANDYSDGIRGTDKVRVGPLRLTASGLVPSRQVLAAALGSFAVAGFAGIAIAATTSWWLIPIGAACILAAWFYTGGSKPYGYRGLGDLSVFVFFGPVAVIGTAYAARTHPGVTWLATLAAIPAGCLAVAVLVANNLRDIPRDAETDKVTLAVLLGDRRTRTMYVGLLAVAFVATGAIAALRPWGAIALLAVPLAVTPIGQVRRGDTGRDLIRVLGATVRLQLGYGLLLAVGLML